MNNTTTNEGAAAVCGTARIIPTRTVVAFQIGARTMRAPWGTTDADASARVRPYVRSAAYTYGYAGPATSSTLIVVAARRRRGDGPGDDWKRAQLRLDALIRAFNTAAV